MKNHVIEVKGSELAPDEFPDDEKKLIRAATEAFEYAYAPYSGYKVGSAVLTRNGNIYTGQNQENFCYTPTDHSEQVALSNANDAGEGDDVIKLACIGEAEGDRHVAPCGWCLTKIQHFEYRARQKMDIIFGGDGAKTLARVYGTKELAPMIFCPEDLHGAVPDLEK
jgi:cytidine deaminase